MSLQDDFNDAADEWRALIPGTYPALPRGQGDAVIALRGLLPLIVTDTPGFRAQADLVEAALLILSQSPHARELAQVALRNNYRIVVGDAVHTSEWAVAGGHTDIINRTIHAVTQDDPLRLALTLAHELTHVAQHDNGFNMSVTDKTPEASIRELMALEADARAHEFIVALELAYKSPDDPDERLLFPQAIDAVSESMGGQLTKKIIDYFRPQFPNIDREEMMARVFKSFYGSLSLRLHYEGSVMKALHDPAVLALRSEYAFAKDFDSAATLKKLGPYAEKAAKYLDLDSAQMAGVTRFSQEAIENWHALRAAPPAPAAQQKPKAPTL